MDWNLVAVMVGIHALMFLTPGPDSIVVVSRATSQGMRHAFAAILGVISAGLFFVPAIAFGMDFVNTLSPAVWMAVRAAGALYLVYIGLKMLRASFASRTVDIETSEIRSLRSEEPLFAAYLQGLLTNLGNPKMIVLLTSFLPQFVAVELGNVSTQILVLGVFMYLNGFVCFSLIALCAVTIKNQIVSRFGSENLSFLGGNLAGGTMLGVGAWMLVAPVKFVMGHRAT
ncbi:LysE family translocator [Vannielia litorea]|uniref:LysE family translocator n=1 Tax=Vannielia litorea TaxID=1217970 RepID=UPI001C93B90D|nr:LysE family translocator [Vannielia litorea]MBY6048333.1 LysE family translocator [Vannielia litorea]MBY6075747.1 LysE family translocator [Vannielia litorea]